MIPAALAGTIALIAVATVVGAMVGRWFRRCIPMAASFAVGLILLAVVFLDLVPDVVSDLAPPGRLLAALAAASGFIAAGRLIRWGCVCEVGTPSNRSTILVAIAIGVHRAVEGSALVAAASIPLAMAVIMHAAGEGYALGAVNGQRRQGMRRLAVGLTVACASPLIGATVLTALPLSDAVHPFVTAVIAGVLTQTGLAALRAGTERRLEHGEPATALHDEIEAVVPNGSRS